MGNRPAKFTQAEFERAIRAAKRQGVAACEIVSDGRVRFILTPPPPGVGGSQEQSPPQSETVAPRRKAVM